MIPSDFESRIQNRYPMIYLRWNGREHTCEIWEKHGDMRICNGWRKLWTYQNPDGTHHPIIYDRIMEWLLRADTRHWGDRDLFREMVERIEGEKRQKKKELGDALNARITEDWTRIAGIPTFFMNPKMPIKQTGLPR